MNSVLAQVIATRSVVAADGSTMPINSNVSEEEGAALQALVKGCGAAVTLEIGLAYGISALFICDALAANGGRKHIVIDPYQLGVRTTAFVAGASHTARVGFDGLGLLNLERAGYTPLVEFHDEPSYRALGRLEAAGERIDFAFIDGWHTFDYVMVDFFLVDRLLKVGGVVVLDDTFYPAIRKVARYIAMHRRYEPVEGFGLMRPSVARRTLNAAARSLRIPGLRSLGQFLRPDIREPDGHIGLPGGNLIAFTKTAEDVLGDGSGGSRRWDQHHEF
jgi:predicted O-methyltransferase YrrM